MNVVGVPKTIDNDLDATEVTFGFDTALVIAPKPLTVSTPPPRAITALCSSKSWAATLVGSLFMPVLLAARISFSSPNSPSNLKPSATLFVPVNFVANALASSWSQRASSCLPADPTGKPIPPVGPGGVANSIAFTLREMLQKEIRVTVLGYVQRGGSPTPFDRILGTRFGVAATDLVAKGQFGRMVCLKAGKMASVSLDEALGKMKFIDPSCEIVHAARAVGATFGDSA